jgi:hypothetical protein
VEDERETTGVEDALDHIPTIAESGIKSPTELRPTIGDVIGKIVGGSRAIVVPKCIEKLVWFSKVSPIVLFTGLPWVVPTAT